MSLLCPHHHHHLPHTHLPRFVHASHDPTWKKKHRQPTSNRRDKIFSSIVWQKNRIVWRKGVWVEEWAERWGGGVERKYTLPSPAAQPAHPFVAEQGVGAPRRLEPELTQPDGGDICSTTSTSHIRVSFPGAHASRWGDLLNLERDSGGGWGWSLKATTPATFFNFFLFPKWVFFFLKMTIIAFPLLDAESWETTGLQDLIPLLVVGCVLARVVRFGWDRRPGQLRVMWSGKRGDLWHVQKPSASIEAKQINPDLLPFKTFSQGSNLFASPSRFGRFFSLNGPIWFDFSHPPWICTLWPEPCYDKPWQNIVCGSAGAVKTSTSASMWRSHDRNRVQEPWWVSITLTHKHNWLQITHFA